jgi:hypothetical protein
MFWFLKIFGKNGKNWPTPVVVDGGRVVDFLPEINQYNKIIWKLLNNIFGAIPFFHGIESLNHTNNAFYVSLGTQQLCYSFPNNVELFSQIFLTLVYICEPCRRSSGVIRQFNYRLWDRIPPGYRAGLPDGICSFIPTITILVYFGGPWNIKCQCILWPFGIPICRYCGHLVYFVVIGKCCVYMV